MKLIMLMAVTPKGVIGNDGSLPWNQREDLRRFKAETMGHAIIMGRKTFESLPNPLHGRLNIVMSSQPAERGDYCVSSLAHAILAAQREGYEKAFIIGGARIFEEAQLLCDEALVTLVQAPDLEGDTVFTGNFQHMQCAHWEDFPKDEHNEYDMQFQRWVRR
jgi:dihydrofolate reductase